MSKGHSGDRSNAPLVTSGVQPSSKKLFDTTVFEELIVSAFTAKEIAMMSEPDIKYELSRVRSMVSEIALQRALIQEQDRALEVNQAAFEEVEQTYLDALAKVEPPKPSVSPTAIAQRGSNAGMRSGSREALSPAV